MGPGVFVPRPETELVAERAMELLPKGGTLVDLCTGSGAIALSVAVERPDARVVATELASAAAEWAERNRAALAPCVELYRGDLFSGLPQALRGDVDVVVSNPPYVDETERALLPRDVIDHEPADALFAPGSGTSVISRIVAEAPGWLRGAASLVLEIGETQGATVDEILSRGGFRDVRVSPDLNGRDRIAEGRWPG